MVNITYAWDASTWKCWAALIASCTYWEVVFADSIIQDTSCWWCNCNLCDLLPPFPVWESNTRFLTVWPNCAFWYASQLITSPDEMVKVDSTDITWYLWPKIWVTWCITKTLNAAGANHVIEIWLDKSCLDIKLNDIVDRPTAATCVSLWSTDMWDWEWCPVCDEECVKQTLVRCWESDTYSWECDECSDPWLRKPRAKMILNNWFTEFQGTNEETAYYVANVNIPRLDSAWWQRRSHVFQEHLRRHKIDTSNSIITILAPWDYHVEWSGNYEQNKAIHATRIWLVHVPMDLSEDIKELAQTRFSWLSDDFYPWQDAWYVWKHEWNYPNNEHTSYNWWTWPQSSIGRLFERLPHWAATIEHFKQWDQIVFFYKISTFMNADIDAASVTWEVSMRWYNDSWVLANDAVKYDVYNIDDTCDRRYWNKKYWIW